MASKDTLPLNDHQIETFAKISEIDIDKVNELLPYLDKKIVKDLVILHDIEVYDDQYSNIERYEVNRMIAEVNNLSTQSIEYVRYAKHITRKEKILNDKRPTKRGRPRKIKRDWDI